ncbi:hypothetical protein HanLR1_Chr05g0183671 [Helianthus annuus]|nr:hypothetical protein HanLR1_Chr05g0183671 [Helianthus annuus]
MLWIFFLYQLEEKREKEGGGVEIETNSEKLLISDLRNRERLLKLDFEFRDITIFLNSVPLNPQVN